MCALVAASKTHCGEPSQVLLYRKCSQQRIIFHAHRVAEKSVGGKCVGKSGRASACSLAWVIEALKASHKDEAEFHKRAVDDLTRELGKIRSRMSQAYEDKLDGKIDERMWNDLHARYTERQEALERQISAHMAADRSYLQQGGQILELANRAYNLYLQQSHEERATLLRFVLLNCSLKDGNHTAVYRKPFDMLANGVDYQ